QRDLSVSHERIGDVLVAQGDLAGAIAAYEASVSIARGLAEKFPYHPQFRSGLAITERRLAALKGE
ncbi:MAG TPA: hypothetical protein DCF61_13480, partial [Alphaproteobacteria bacterium]|nr:hypothetical protein [Alphaproteobacteria bacterium]